MDDFIAKGVFAQGSRRDLALSHIGVAVAAGAKRPDISTPEAFRATLLATPLLRRMGPPVWIGWAVPLASMLAFFWFLRSFFLR